MTKAIAIALGLALSFGTSGAQPKKKTPAPQKEPKKAPPDKTPEKAPEKAPAPEPPKDPSKVDPQKADNLDAGKASGDDRPWAKGVSQDKQESAIKLFVEGNGYLNDGIFAKAVESYQQALKFWDHPAIHYNMALALDKLDRPIEVEISMTKAIAYGSAPLETEDKFEHAKEYLVLNAKQLAWVDVSCDKVGAHIEVDGKEVFVVEAGKPNRYEARVKVGKHTVVAQKTGYNAQVDAPFIEPGQRFRIELKLYTDEELTRYKHRWDARWMPYAVIGAGAALLGGGFLMEHSAQSSYDDFDQSIARCNVDSMNQGCTITSDLTSKRDSGDTKKLLGYVGFGLAGAVAVTGGILLYLNRETSYEITADQYKKELREGKVKPKGAVAITPIVAPTFSGALIQGRF